MTPAEITRIREYIVSNEGRRSRAYCDTLGLPTIGVGFNLRRSDAPRRIEALGLNFSQVAAGTQSLTDDQIDGLFDDDFDTALAGAMDLVPCFEILSPGRQDVLVDMAFNVGIAGLSRFSRFLSALNASDWETAEAEIVNSLYFRQVGDRGKRNAAAVGRGYHDTIYKGRD